jgi:hypothetical protein
MPRPSAVLDVGHHTPHASVCCTFSLAQLSGATLSDLCDCCLQPRALDLTADMCACMGHGCCVQEVRALASGQLRPSTLRALQNTVQMIEKASGKQGYRSRLLQPQVSDLCWSTGHSWVKLSGPGGMHGHDVAALLCVELPPCHTACRVTWYSLCFEPMHHLLRS